MRGCLFVLLLVLVGALAVMQCPGSQQPEVVEEELAPPPPPPPPDSQLPVTAELIVGGASSLVVGGRVLDFGVSAIAGSGADAIVVAWVEPKGDLRESITLRLDAARSSAPAGPVVITLIGIDPVPAADGGEETIQVRVSVDALDRSTPPSKATPLDNQ